MPEERPHDLISMREAATTVGKSRPTIRRWIKQGHLTRYDAPAPPHGGTPPTLVSRSELMLYVVTAGVQPSEETDPGVDAPPVEPVRGIPADPGVDLRVQLAQKEGELQLARLEGELREVRAQLEAARAELTALRNSEAARFDTLHRSYLERTEEVRRERLSAADWRARFDAKEVELRAYRELGSMPWYRRLLAGPVREEIPELPDLAMDAAEAK